jgi:hypothetical protein
MQPSPFRGQYPSSLASKLVSSLLSQPALEVERGLGGFSTLSDASKSELCD